MNCLHSNRVFSLSLAAVSAFLLINEIGIRSGYAKERITDELAEYYYAGYDSGIGNIAKGLKEDKEFQAEVWAILRDSKKPKTRGLAYQMIVWAKLAGYEDLIRKSGKDISDEVRAARIFDLAKVYQGDELVNAYLEMLSDKSHFVRYDAAEQLQRHPTKKAVEPLLKLLADESIEVRERAMDSLRRFKLPEVKTRLKDLAKDKNPTVAGTASVWLLRYDERDVDLSLVHELLESELLPKKFYGGDNVRGIVQLLEKYGDASSLPVLRKAAENKHKYVAEAAKLAIQAVEERMAK